MRFNLDIDTSLEATLYILNRVKSCDIHKLFKLLYLSDKKHLFDYGAPITGDYYVAMKNGPVPSFVYDVVKFVRGDNPYLNVERDLNSIISVVENMYVGANREADLDHLAETHIETIEQIIAEYKDLDFFTMTDVSHDGAWQSATRNDEMKMLDIASAAGADIAMIKYIQSNMENQKSFSC